MAKAGTSKLLGDREMAAAERRLTERMGGLKRRSKVLTDQEASDFEAKMQRESFVRAVLRDWERT